MFFFKKTINSYIKTGKFWICLKKKQKNESVNHIICKLKNKNFKIIQTKKNLYFSSKKTSNILFWKLLNINLFSLNVFWYYRFKLIGVGYKISLDKKTNDLNVSYGYSNIQHIKLPKSIKFYELPERQLYGISSINKMNLLNFLNKLEKIRRFDPYKGKGLIFENKFYLRKTNKKNDK